AEGPLFGTDNICRALAEIAGRSGDPRVVLGGPSASVLARSAQELVWQAMSTQVQLVVGLRVAKLPAENVFFEKAKAGMLGSLAWLEARAGEVIAELPEPRDLSLFEVTLFCLLEHLGFRPSVSLEPFPALRGFAATFGSRESARGTPYRFDPPPTPATDR
ncbi:MAG: hypothetical protein IPM79_35350, partial [Polyangiaceae bacterium]|nr:hypothetical protein [Polyangiaceae bacterium]